jgi:DNA primase
MASREQIEQIRSSIDIVELIREYVPSLKSSGRSVKGLCPFHSERTPSFHVHGEKGMFKCFGCGESGDAIAFLSKMEQLSFIEALQVLADRAGVRLERAKPQEQREPEGIKDKLYRVLEDAKYLYEERLWDERIGEEGRSYLNERRITDETAEKFHLGFAAGGAVFEALVKKGFAIELLQQAGLVVRSAAGKFYDPMFGRLIFPIHDSFGHVIGFGGRVLPKTQKKSLLGGDDAGADEGPKYLNSPETPVFSKGKSLYGLMQAKSEILMQRRVVIMEGYMDVIGVHQAGMTNAVATLGTAFTRDHAKVIKRYATEVTAFFDPDEAGQRAAVRSIEPMLQEDLFPKVVVADSDLDPDEIAQEKGLEHLNQLVQNAPDFLDYSVLALGATKESSLQRKSEIARQVMGMINQSPNPILKSEWTSRLANALGLRAESLMSAGSGVKNAPISTPVRPARPYRMTLPTAEEELLHLLIADARGFDWIGLEEQDFSIDRCRRVFEILRRQHGSTGKISVPALCDEVEEADRDWILRLSMEERDITEVEERFRQLASDVIEIRDRKRLQELSQKLKSGGASADDHEQYKDLLKRLKGSVNEKGLVPK